MIRTRVSGIDEFVDYVKDLPRGVKVKAMRAIAMYIIGNEHHGLKHEPRYKHVTRRRGMSHLSYKTKTGKRVIGYVSAKQHRWVMANYKKRKMGTNQRNHAYQNGWVQEPKTSDWRRVDIINREHHAQYVGGSNQVRLNAKVGWRKVRAIVESNMTGALKAGQKAVDDWIAKKK